MSVTALLSNKATFQPGFQLSNADGNTLTSMVNSLNQASSQINSITQNGYNGSVGSSTPNTGVFTTVTVSGTELVSGGVLRSLAVASTAVTSVLQGLLNISATVAKAYTLGTPVATQDLNILCSGGSTAKRQAKAPAGVSIFGFLSSALGSSKAKTSLNFTGKGQSVWLRGLSSVAYYVVGKAGNVAST